MKLTSEQKAELRWAMDTLSPILPHWLSVDELASATSGDMHISTGSRKRAPREYVFLNPHTFKANGSAPPKHIWYFNVFFKRSEAGNWQLHVSLNVNREIPPNLVPVIVPHVPEITTAIRTAALKFVYSRPFFTELHD